MKGLLVVGFYLTQLFFSLIILLLWTRIALRYFKVSMLHPIGQFIYKITNPLMNPIEQRLFPKKTYARYDFLSLICIAILSLIKFIILGLLAYKVLLPISILFIFVLADLIVQPCNLLFYALLIRVILSWVNPQWDNPLTFILKTITDPLIKLGHKIVPNISGFDFAPFVIMVIFKVITLFISASMPLSLL